MPESRKRLWPENSLRTQVCKVPRGCGRGLRQYSATGQRSRAKRAMARSSGTSLRVMQITECLRGPACRSSNGGKLLPIVRSLSGKSFERNSRRLARPRDPQRPPRPPSQPHRLPRLRLPITVSKSRERSTTSRLKTFRHPSRRHRHPALPKLCLARRRPGRRRRRDSKYRSMQRD